MSGIALYEAAAGLDVDEYSVDNRKWWRLPDQDLVALV
jgi:hypothetical protein